MALVNLFAGQEYIDADMENGLMAVGVGGERQEVKVKH